MPRTNNTDKAVDRTDVGGTPAAAVAYSPDDVTRWESGDDPGNVNDALDQLGDRVLFHDGSRNLSSYIDIDTIADPGAPAAGDVRFFAIGHHLIALDANDLWHDLSMGGGGTSSSIHEAITVTDAGGLTITWSAGAIFDTEIAGGHQIVTIAAQGAPQACAATSINYLFYDHSALALALNAAGPDYTDGDIDVAHILTIHNDILMIIQRPLAPDVVYGIQEVLQAVVPGVVVDGLIVSEHAGANAFDVDQSAGSFVHGGFELIVAAAIDSTVIDIIRWFHDAADAWTTDANSEIDEDFWDGTADGLVLQANVGAKYYRSVFVTCGDHIHWIYPQEGHNTINQALIGNDPILPPALAHSPKTVALVMKGDDIALPAPGSDQWIDVRPTISAGEGGGPVTDHGNLGGLPDVADHAYALLHDGTRPLTGNWDAGAFTITAGGLTAQLDDNANAPTLTLNRGRVGPAAVQLGDVLGAVTLAGYDGAGYDIGAYFLAAATENWDAVSHGSKLQIYAIADGTVAPTIMLNTEAVAAADGAINIKNDTAANGPEIGVWSSGANVDLTLTSKGTGDLNLTAGGDILPTTILMATDTKIRFRADTIWMHSSAADKLEINVVAAGQIDFAVGGNREMWLDATRLNFNAGATDPALGWAVNGRLDIYMAASLEVMFQVNAMIFNNGAITTGLTWARSGILAVKIGGFDEIAFEANMLSFRSGAVETGFLWSTSGRMGFHVGAVEEMHLQANALEMVGDDGFMKAGYFVAKGTVAAGAAGNLRFGDEVLAPNAGAPVLPLFPAGAAGVAHGWHVKFDGVTKTISPMWTF